MNHNFSILFGITVDFCQKEKVSSNNTALQHDVTFPIWDQKRRKLQETQLGVDMAKWSTFPMMLAVAKKTLSNV